MKVPKYLVDKFRFSLGGLPLLDKYILSQLIPPLFLSVGIFASLGVAIGNLSDLANKIVDYHLPLELAIRVLLLKIPEFISYALPVSVLLTTLITYGSLSANSEIIALRTCGVSLYRIIIPSVVLSLVVTGLTFAINEWLVPSANYQATSILVESINEEHDFWQTKDIFFPDYEDITLPDGQTLKQLRSLFYAEKFDGREMKSLTVLKWIKQRLSQIVISENARWNDSKKTWDFFNGTVYLLASDESYSRTIPFEHRQFSLPQEAFEFASLARNPYEMNLGQALRYKNLLKLSRDEKNVRLFEVRIQQKIAFPFVCLVFGLVGASLGNTPKNISRATSFGLTLGIVFSYYLLNFLAGSFGIVGIFSPVVAAWIPNVFGLAIGIYLLKRING